MPIFKSRLKRAATLAVAYALAISAGPLAVSAGTAALAAETSDSLQAKLNDAERIYKDGKTAVAIEQATKLLGTHDNSVLKSDRVARDAKADLCVFQLKAGRPDESARLIRELLLTLQLEAPMDPRFAPAPAEVYAQFPKMLKDNFGKVVVRLGETKDTKQILDALVDNTVPKDYASQLNAHCKRVDQALKKLDELKSIADGEELKYGDPLSSLDEEPATDEGKPDTATLDKLGSTLDELATNAQQMPVGDARPALALYRLALVANSMKRFPQAETLAKQSISHINALSDDVSGLPDVQVALAYALAKQGKIDEFKAVKDEYQKTGDERERLKTALNRFEELLPKSQ